MNAGEALTKSKINLIESNVRNGLMIIFQENNTSEKFHLYLVPFDEHKKHNPPEKVEIGLYDDLDIAVTIACIGCGAYDSKWQPPGQVSNFGIEFEATDSVF